MSYRELAEAVVAALFVNGQGQQAERLVLMQGERDLGGWARTAARDRIEKAIDEHSAPPPCAHRFGCIDFGSGEPRFACTECDETIPGTSVVATPSGFSVTLPGRLGVPE